MATDVLVREGLGGAHLLEPYLLSRLLPMVTIPHLPESPHSPMLDVPCTLAKMFDQIRLEVLFVRAGDVELDPLLNTLPAPLLATLPTPLAPT